MATSNIAVMIPGAGNAAVNIKTDVPNSTDNTKVTFANMMNQSLSSSYGSLSKASGSNNIKTSDMSKKNEIDTTMKNVKSNIKPAVNQLADAQSKVADVAEELEEEIKDTVKEDLSLTEDQLTQVMSQLGLAFTDLMNPANLAQVVAQVNGDSDISNMLTSNDFVDLVQSIGDIMQSFAEKTGISVENLQTVMEQFDQMNVGEDMLQNPQDVVSQDFSKTINQTESDINHVPDKAESDSADHQVAVEIVGQDSYDTENIQEPVQEDNEVHIPVQVNVEQDAKGNAQTSDSGEETMNNGDLPKQDTPKSAKSDHVEVFAHTVEQHVQTMNPVPLETPVAPAYQTNVNVADIIDQIAEYAKINVSQESTSIEMQLNPENLGKVYLQISSSKEGNITAQLTASSDVVKQALETQVAELRQTLNQQGVKVDAIEVTVASHEFEKNLEQNAQGERQQAEDGQQQQTIRRNLHMDNLDELSGLLTEEEVLAAKIMKDNGNTMDVIA